MVHSFIGSPGDNLSDPSALVIDIALHENGIPVPHDISIQSPFYHKPGLVLETEAASRLSGVLHVYHHTDYFGPRFDNSEHLFGPGPIFIHILNL